MNRLRPEISLCEAAAQNRGHHCASNETEALCKKLSISTTKTVDIHFLKHKNKHVLWWLITAYNNRL